ncbi:MAG: carboxypeptidase regulatory-like domain-containing protein, partial [Mycetocola sp.]
MKTVRNHRSVWAAIPIAGLLVLSSLGLASPAAAEESIETTVNGTVYYVDATEGDDANGGQAAGDAWKTLERVNRTTFAPGDSILLQSGESWVGQLWPKGSGSHEAPIAIGRYGDGPKPAIRGDGGVADAVRLFNQQHWVVSDLDVSNATTTQSPQGADLRDLRGIHVSGDNGQTLSGITISRVDVHDVTGEVNWISGDVAGNAPGIRFKTGWDGSKKTGGIVFDTTVQDIRNPQATPTILDDVVIEDSTIVNTSFAGIVVKQYTGDGTDGQGNTIATRTGWGTRDNATDAKFQPHTDFTIRGNYVRQDGTQYGCNGIYLTNVRGALVENNVVHRAGTSGIETYFADDVVIQYNEVYDTQRKAGGADSNGIDPDKGTTKQLIQYNYLHGNGDGVLICQFAFGDAVIRYNVITHSSRYPIYLHSDRAARAEVYNNTIHNSTSNYLIYGYGTSLAATYNIRNNIIHSTRAHATLTTSPTITYDNNLYSGAELTVPTGDTRALVGDAAFVGPEVTGPYGTADTGPQLALAGAYATSSGSKAVNTGLDVPGAPAIDYAGGPIPVGATDIGAFEYRSPEGATTESLSGFVRDGAGRALSAVTVRAESGGVVKTAQSDATGWFRITDLPSGQATVTASRTGYQSEPVTATVGSATSGLTQIILTSTSDVGSVSGRVLTVSGGALAGARVTVVATGEEIASGISGADGTFRIADVPIGEAYTVRAVSGELRADEAGGLRVDPAADTAVRALLLQPAEPDVIFADDFDGRVVGGLPTGTDGYTVSSSGGSVAIADAGDNRALKLTRSTNSGSTSVQRNSVPPLTGIVTVEARIMRDDGNTPAANWFSVPYIAGANGANAVSIAFSKGRIIAYKGTASTDLMAYQQGRWYTLRTVVDTINQRFDLFIDGVRVIDDATFRNPLTGGVARIDYYANSSNYGSAHVDDLRILQGSDRDRSEAGLAALTTDAGEPVFDGERWRLQVGAAVDDIVITATPASATALGLTVDGIATRPGEPSAPVALSEGPNELQIVVT